MNTDTALASGVLSEIEIGRRVVEIRERIAAAAARAGRDPATITLVAVSKTHPASLVARACRAGLTLFGENRVEEAAPKAAEVAELLAPLPQPAWHLVGHLQSRKAPDVRPWCSMVHSLDSVKLAMRLNRAGLESGIALPVLLEVNMAGEASKYGFAPGELSVAVAQISAMPGLNVQGVMTVAPMVDDPEKVRPVFRALRELRDRLGREFRSVSWDHLSMGMTDDFEVAVEEGATLVRIGRAIFGER